MLNILIGKIYLFPPIFLRAGDLNDRDCCCFDKFYTLNVLFHLLLLQDELDLAQKFKRIHLKLFVRRCDSDIDVRLL